VSVDTSHDPPSTIHDPSYMYMPPFTAIT